MNCPYVTIRLLAIDCVSPELFKKIYLRLPGFT
jgi:hypothetical protein